MTAQTGAANASRSVRLAGDPVTLTPPERWLRQEARRRLNEDPDAPEPKLCGQQPTAQGWLVASCNEGDFAHADSGWVDFFHVAEVQHTLLLQSELRRVSSGSGFGNMGEVHPIMLGDNTPGFVVEGGYGNHGYFSSNLAVVGLLDGELRSLAFVSFETSNTGSSDCERRPATCIEAELKIAAQGKRSPRDLEVVIEGERGGRPWRRRFQLAFDRRRLAYRVPLALQLRED